MQVWAQMLTAIQVHSGRAQLCPPGAWGPRPFKDREVKSIAPGMGRAVTAWNSNPLSWYTQESPGGL